MLKVDPEQLSMPDINPEKVCFIVEKARELFSEDVGVDADASNPSDDGERQAPTDAADAPIRQ